MRIVARRRKLTKSLEDYLEAVLVLVRRGRVARVRDIARRLGVGSPSVTAAMRSLSQRGLVNYDPYEVVTLTERGLEAAGKIQHRHEVIRGFLTDVLGVAADAAEDYACRMEHAVDDTLLERFGKLADLVRQSPADGADWLESFRRYCSTASRRAKPRGRTSPPSSRSRKHAKGTG
jgi:DtxR family Mn-dependent transcriptional regulator